MANEGRRKRLKSIDSIPLLAKMDHRNFVDQKNRNPWLESLSRNERRVLAKESRKIAGQYKKIIKELGNSGAGFLTDKQLRIFATEYTHRFASSGTQTQPISFNYIEPFLNISTMPNSFAPSVALTEEVDHLFNISDFFDHITSKTPEDFDLGSLMNLQSDKTYHFTTNGDLLDLSFLNPDRGEFVISGFSMIRRDRSLHWYLIGGEVLSEDEWKLRCSQQPEIDLKNIDSAKRAFLTERIKEVSSMGPPFALEGAKFTHKTIIAGEIDLTTQKHLSKCYMLEHENTFSMYCDDPEVLFPLGKESQNKIMLLMNEHINKASIVWNLAEGLLQLPQYFSHKLQVKKEVLVHAGKRHDNLNFSKGGSGLRSKYKVVSAIDTNSLNSENPIREILLPHYQSEVDGYWKHLSKDENGYDREGNVIKGKTWVTESLNREPQNRIPRIVYVKDSLRIAKIRIEEYEKALKDTVEEPVTQNDCNGELYVMRCPALAEQIYKVGWTSKNPSVRAKELSSSTGVPLAFIVVKSWKHPNPRELEKEVHMMLSPYCINGRREFFYASFEKIENIIETVIGQFKDL